MITQKAVFLILTLNLGNVTVVIKPMAVVLVKCDQRYSLLIQVLAQIQNQQTSV